MTQGITTGKLRRWGARRTEPIPLSTGQLALSLIGTIHGTAKVRLAARSAKIKGIQSPALVNQLPPFFVICVLPCTCCIDGQLVRYQLINSAPERIRSSREVTQRLVVAEEAALGTSATGEEYSARRIGLSVTELFLDAAQVPAVAALESNGAVGIGISCRFAIAVAAVVKRTEADCTVQGCIREGHRGVIIIINLVCSCCHGRDFTERGTRF